MNYRRIVFSLVLLISAIILTCAGAHAEPVLIKLALEESSDWANAISLGVVAYQRFDNFVLAEFESERLGELDRVGLEYQIIDEDPWSKGYFWVSPIEGVAKVNLELYGKILLTYPKWQLIKASREKAFELMPMGYRITPIRHKPIPLKYKSPLKVAKGALKYSADIDSLLNLVSEDSLRTWVQRLQDFYTRFTLSDSIPFARQWIYDKFSSFGISDVRLDTFVYDSDDFGEQQGGNVVAIVPARISPPDKLIVVGGHYDSIRWRPGSGDSTSFDDPNIAAPGADDNASGASAVLELARIIAANPLRSTIIFITFDAEEIPPFCNGSWAYADSIAGEGIDLDLMMNFDMIGYTQDTGPYSVIIFHGGTYSPYAELMDSLARRYTSLIPELEPNSAMADAEPFYENGYEVVYAFEWDFSPGYHSAGDTIGLMDIPYMTEVVKMGLATLLTGNSPSPVESLKAVDAGEGHTIYLSWSANPPGEDVVNYNVYFGTTSGDYDSLHQVYAICDTLRNLKEDTTYFIAVSAVNSDDFESPVMYEVSVAPKVVPLAPTGLVANPNGSYKIKLTWIPNQEADFDYYNIYRSEESGTDYQLLSGACRETTFVDSTVQGDVEYYYYTLTAVDTSENESEMSDEVEAFVVTLDQGILLVDETYINGSYNMVDGDSINAFYDRALQNYTYAYADHSYPPNHQITLKELGRYSVVIIHSEDQREFHSLGAYGDSTYSVLKKYLNCGGKAIIEGRRNLSPGHSINCGTREFFPGDIPYDYLKVKSAYVPCWSPVGDRSEEFIGAFSSHGYPYLQVDSLRIAQCSCELDSPLAGKVPGVGYIDSLMDGQIIYTFHSAYDTSASEGKPVAFRYLGDDYQVIFFDFPLYFIQEQQATELLDSALSDLDMFTDVEGKEEVKVPASFSLGQNHPNPFNSETIIEYSLPKASQVKIAIYNILGQKVRTLLDQRQSAGYKRVIWDGKNEKGKVVSSGIYFYRMETEEFVRSKKMLFLK